MPAPRTPSRLLSSSLWILALLLTLALAVYQRLTGPTHPVRGELDMQGSRVRWLLERSHGGEGDQPVEVEAPDPDIQAEIAWRFYPGDHPWSHTPMSRQGTLLRGHLPHQPPAGKLEYAVILSRQGLRARLPAEGESVIMRFKGAVPPWLLVPHVILMFTAMLTSSRAGLEALAGEPARMHRLTLVTTVLLTLGGLLLGGLVQLHAFGQFWTGFPFGTDLTDNKLAVALAGWVLALVACRRGRSARGWVLFASLTLLVVFLIPHSLFGSELQR